MSVEDETNFKKADISRGMHNRVTQTPWELCNSSEYLPDDGLGDQIPSPHYALTCVIGTTVSNRHGLASLKQHFTCFSPPR